MITRKGYIEGSVLHKNSSPTKLGKIGRWISGRKKHDVGTEGGTGAATPGHIIVDKRGGLVKSKIGGVTTKYKKRDRPTVEFSNITIP